ncbi:hypothetical protein [Heliothis virescens ascovirus 3e]|uniref:Poxvirus late transcription factor VLTF3-like protein n=1 Tax=Heliothis virescens ascovirus 3e TaxID=260797 RepID=A4KX88_HVAVE|nr:hypothetical protein HVAV3e_gp032 [Heliothis virescens ascovirus 3e]ABO37219.1 hypothetical protein [Heliothis virescens ascovirus 3e]AXN77214.1 hypothetical protein HvAV-3i_gp031 [Heliothis virescens ascovirus 3i]
MNDVTNRDLLELDDTIRNMCGKTAKRCRLANKHIAPNVRRTMLNSVNKSHLKGRMMRAVLSDISTLDRMASLLSSQVIYVTGAEPIITDYMKLLSKAVDKDKEETIVRQKTKLSQKYCDLLNVTLNVSNVYGDLLRCSNTASEAACTNQTNAGYKSGKTANMLTDYKCDICGNESKFNRDTESVNCGRCGGEIVQCVDGSRPAVNGSYRHSTNGSNNVYNRTMHFRDCLYQYQGVHTPILSAEVFESLTKAMRECNVMGDTGDLQRDGASVTKGDVLYYLKQLNYTRHYDDAVYIHRVLTGRSADNVQHLEERLMHDFTLLSKKYDEQHAGKRERRSFINMQIVLYQLLRRYGHKCKLEDFASIKSLEQRARRDELYKELFMSLGWKYEDI